MSFQPSDIATKLAVAILIGLLVGFERQWAHKDLGVRTFAIVSLFGTLASLLSATYALVALGGIVALLAVINIGHFVRQVQASTTTAVALLVTYTLGVLVGSGHVFTPTASAILMTLLLALKPQFSRFAGGLNQEEVRGAVMLGLIGFVIYPVLPNRYIDPYNLVNPREAWLTVILIAAIGFANYILLRLYSARGIYYTAIFGGLVNSTAAIAELARAMAAMGTEAWRFGVVLNLLTIASMFARNFALLLIFSPQAALLAVAPMALMILTTIGFAWWKKYPESQLPDLQIGSPFSLRKVAVFGLLFLAIQISGALGQRWFGHYGTIVVSIIGGTVSSASSTAAAASLSGHQQLSHSAAALATVLASISSTVVNLPIIYRQTNDRRLVQRLALISALIMALGLAALALETWILGS